MATLDPQQLAKVNCSRPVWMGHLLPFDDHPHAKQGDHITWPNLGTSESKRGAISNDAWTIDLNQDCCG